MKNFYITTTLPYVNDKPHIGHTLEFLQADVITRYMRKKLGKENVFFNLGTDEHGLKIYNKAIENGLTPQEYVDSYAEKWKEFCTLYKIEYDNFYRTTDTTHQENAKKFWLLMKEKGYIYKKKYEGLYCVGCEGFKTEKELVNGLCPDHKKAPVKYSEENYFLKLSQATDKLLEFFEQNKNFIVPENKYKALVNFVKEGLQDISISRLKENLPWGIEIPDDPEQVMYVWFDALTNYIFSVGYYGDKSNEFSNWWPALQICGPDNLKFQGAIWQGMLALAGIDFTEKILIHGMVLAEDGVKMSKTIGNVIDPVDLLNRYPLDAIRFYLIANCPTFDDFSFSEGRLVDLYNDGLADKFGNLLNRVIHLANKYEIKTSEKFMEEYEKTLSADFKNKVNEHINKFHSSCEKYDLFDAYQNIIELSSWGNQYITEQKPWEKGKDPSQIQETQQILKNLIYLLWQVVYTYELLIPNSIELAKKFLNNNETGVLFQKL